MKMGSRPSLRRQQGVVLFIALIVLVAMALAGIAMRRSVDTTLGIAGNLAFKQATIQASDQGVSTAYAWISANAAGAGIQSDNIANSYFASLAADPDWFNMANWGSSVVLNAGTPDAAGNVVRYMMHRMCASTGPYNAPGQQCALYTPTSTAASGSTMTVGSYQFQGNPQVFIRITTRVDGPRNTVSITQTSVLVDAT